MSIVTMTKTEKAAAEVVFQGLLADFQAALEPGSPPDPNHYFVVKALWARAHGADAVSVVG